jgi:aldehyde dehydrogenase (NAD+)
MKKINKNYINGEFMDMDGIEVMDIISPSTKETIGSVTLGSVKDVQVAVSAAKAALKTFSKTTVNERVEMLQRLHDVMMSKSDELIKATVEEYGAPVSIATNLMLVAAKAFLNTKEALEEFEFVRSIGRAKVTMVPLGVVGMITPWNADYYQICAKLAPAIATGCTAVIKPSELSAIQTQLLLECFHEAGIPKGVINVVNGRGEVVGTEITRNPDISMISFTGSTNVGKAIRRGAVDTMKRVTLEMGGKSPNIILEDADFRIAIPLALRIAFGNSGQACIAGTRLIIPENRLEEVKQIIKIVDQNIKVGKLWDKDSAIGAIVNERQYERVQRYIRAGIMEGAELVIGGEGSPQGLENGYYVKPTVFANVTMDMTIAKEEIFGPVLSILTYKTEEEAIEIANNTDYGLAAYISSTDLERANSVASQIEAGRVVINMTEDEPRAPFGGFKQSGIGRENGVFGMEEYVEPKTILGYK